ncbi:MAG TPA: EAL domain-containing protein, partial [Acidimicrobiales bacterium]|nr:EAL domain-containing protein [Acidimicrobiales bacterium]
NVGIQLGRVTERWRAQQALAHQAMHDSLTGLANRALFLDRVSHSLDRLVRQPGNAAVLFLDLDRFKDINDSLGHDAGDQVLVAVARRLENVLRRSDTVARFGGDEFTIFCEDLEAESHAVTLAERVDEALSVPLEVEGRDISITTSIGIAYARGKVNGEDLLRDADMAMYRAKQEGRARYALFDPDMHAAATQRLETANALRTAIKNQELRLHFQPQVSLAGGGLIGVEALVRWQHPVTGLVWPGEFIPVAEESNSIIELGRWVVDEACRQVAEWDAAAPGVGPLGVSVNISARQLADPRLVDVVARALAKSGLDPARVCLEVTESVLMTDVEASFEALSGLKRLGVNLAVDDFGTGYSSLSYLQRLPVDLLKVDKSFVHGMNTDRAKAAIVRSVVDLAHALHLEVLAEGVETAEQAAMLGDLGCDRAQGYFFGRPVPPGALLDTIA